MSDPLVLAMNLEIYATTQYVGYPFNSFCEFDGVPIGAGDGGIFQLDTGDLDHSSDIDAFVEFPKLDFGSPMSKHARRVTINGLAMGDLQFTCSADDGPEFVKNIRVKALGRHSFMAEYLRSDCRGTYLQFKLSNVNGAYFSISSIDLDLIIPGMRETPA
jgi:hypothetical protein